MLRCYLYPLLLFLLQLSFVLMHSVLFGYRFIMRCLCFFVGNTFGLPVVIDNENDGDNEQATKQNNQQEALERAYQDKGCQEFAHNCPERACAGEQCAK